MADFELIEKHPWVTVAAIGGGGLILYFLMRGGSSSGASATPVYQATSGAADPNADALTAQTQQINAQLQGESIQGNTQIALAQIGAGVQSQGITASADVTNNQTSAQLQLGMGTLGAQVATEQISAGVQMATIDAIVRAFTGSNAAGNPITNPAPPVQTPVVNSTGNPISTYTQPNNVYVMPPAYQPGPGTSGVGSGGSTTSGIIPGGNTLVPVPNFATCDPRDVACVNNNQQIDINYENQKLVTNASNNRAQCLANAQQNAGQPNYAALVAACG
jgi:hypothetical protein